MKKVFVLMFAVVALGFASNAQNAIGLRFGAGTASNAEISYQMGLGANRLELDLGWTNTDNSFYLAGIYQWKFNLTGEFNWFVGPGAVLGYCPNHGINLAVAGQIGLEWAPSSIPFNVSLDARPAYTLLAPEHCGNVRGFGWGVSLGIRYRLN